MKGPLSRHYSHLCFPPGQWAAGIRWPVNDCWLNGSHEVSWESLELQWMFYYGKIFPVYVELSTLIFTGSLIHLKEDILERKGVSNWRCCNIWSYDGWVRVDWSLPSQTRKDSTTLQTAKPRPKIKARPK